jgi:hypothetical protein
MQRWFAVNSERMGHVPDRGERLRAGGSSLPKVLPNAGLGAASQARGPRAALQEGALRSFAGRSGSVNAANWRDRGHGAGGQEVDEDRVA